jgi:rare lipoprotein A
MFDADGRIFGQEGCLTAAHCGIMRARGYKGGEWILVEYKRTGRAVWVWVNDTGAFEPYGRIIDLSYKAAKLIGMERAGIGTVRIYRLLENQRKYPI